MITLLVCGYAYIVWLLTGINPLPHITTDLVSFFGIPLYECRNALFFCFHK